jgi:hypothetical protein
VLALLTLVVGMVLTAWVAWLIFARGKRQIDAAMAYRGVARTLELEVDTRGVSVQGHLGDRRLWVGEVMVGHGPDRSTAVWGVVDLQRPLGLGLQIRRRGLSERVFRRRRAPGIELGHAIDRRVEVLGDEQPRVRHLLGDGEVRASLTRLMDRHPDVVVTDRSVRVHLDRPLTSERALHGLVEGMLELAGALETSRAEVRPPDRLTRWIEDWRDLADRRDLDFEGWLPAMNGPVAGGRLVIAAARTARGYTADIRLYVADHRPLGLRIRHQTEPDGYWSVGQDIQLDDPTFDARFVVKGWDPGRIRAVLDAPARAALLHAASVGQLHVEDARIHLSALPMDTLALEEAIDAAVAVARTLGWVSDDGDRERGNDATRDG